MKSSRYLASSYNNCVAYIAAVLYYEAPSSKVANFKTKKNVRLLCYDTIQYIIYYIYSGVTGAVCTESSMEGTS